MVDLYFPLRNAPVRVGVCVPRDATLQLRGSYPVSKHSIEKWTQLASLAELDGTQDMQSYYWDKTIGLAYPTFLSACLFAFLYDACLLYFMLFYCCSILIYLHLKN